MGFTTAELLVVLALMGTLALAGLPRFGEALTHERMRTALTTVAGYAAVARETAVARGCATTLHLSSGWDGRVVITSCRLIGPGVDTVGVVDSVASRLRVKVWSTSDMIRFGPSGLRLDYEVTTVAVGAEDGEAALEFAINPVGRVIWP
ncbi:MAG: Tfp pilus assembly protein FimT/FimU [Gemmatimonadaceae bacterium]